MLKCARATFFAAVLCFGFSVSAQTLPCPTGTLANVLGTSCSVGPIIFNFGTDFQGFTVSGGLGRQITPADIGFIPVQSDNKLGFRLVLNFGDAPANGFAGVHFINFSYTPQAAPGSEIRVQSLSMDAHATPGEFGFVQVNDFQFYSNSGFLQNLAQIDQEDVSALNQLSDSHILEVPGLLSTGSGFAGLSTTNLVSFSNSTGNSSVSLASATFLYTTGPLLPTPGLAALSYTNIDLPGVAATFVSNITNSGRMVGSYQDFAGNFHGYVQDADGSFAAIDVPGAPNTFGDGLNERGDVVGGFTGPDGHTHGFLQHDGVISTFSVPGARFTAPFAINNKGQIVGEYQSADRNFHGFLFADGAFVTIDEGPDEDSAAFALNNFGEIAGPFFDPNTFRSYLLKNNSVTTIDVPGQGDTAIQGINNRGDSVGIFNDINLAQHGFVFSKGTFRTVDFPGGNNSAALGTNDSGKIVGGYLAPDGSFHSFLATPALDDGEDHRPTASSANPSQPKPDCEDAEWRGKHDMLRNAGLCHMKQ